MFDCGEFLAFGLVMFHLEKEQRTVLIIVVQRVSLYQTLQ